MSWPGYSGGDLVAIAAGGSLGATIRWWLGHTDPIDSVLVWDPPSLTDADFAPPFNLDGNLLILIDGFPTGTLMVNMLGCLILGGLTALFGRSVSAGRQRTVVAAAIGFCGSLTTFSTFAVEVAERLRGQPTLVELYPDVADRFDPAIGDALLYIVISVIGGGLAFWLGRFTAQRSVTSPGDVTLGDAS